MSHRTLRSSALRLAALTLGAGCALALPASNARASAPAGRYTIANGTVTDNATKLVWQQTPATCSYTWQQAQGYCAGLSLAGGGWRVPSVDELMTLVDLSVPAPGPTIDSTAFPNTTAYYFWASEPLAGNPAGAWAVYFVDGTANNYNTSSVVCVRCVR